jgi:hypothetical protein
VLILEIKSPLRFDCGPSRPEDQVKETNLAALEKAKSWRFGVREPDLSAAHPPGKSRWCSPSTNCRTIPECLVRSGGRAIPGPTREGGANLFLRNIGDCSGKPIPILSGSHPRVLRAFPFSPWRGRIRKSPRPLFWREECVRNLTSCGSVRTASNQYETQQLGSCPWVFPQIVPFQLFADGQAKQPGHCVKIRWRRCFEKAIRKPT